MGNMFAPNATTSKRNPTSLPASPASLARPRQQQQQEQPSAMTIIEYGDVGFCLMVDSARAFYCVSDSNDWVNGKTPYAFANTIQLKFNMNRIHEGYKLYRDNLMGVWNLLLSGMKAHEWHAVRTFVIDVTDDAVDGYDSPRHRASSNLDDAILEEVVRTFKMIWLRSIDSMDGSNNSMQPTQLGRISLQIADRGYELGATTQTLNDASACIQWGHDTQQCNRIRSRRRRNVQSRMLCNSFVQLMELTKECARRSESLRRLDDGFYGTNTSAFEVARVMPSLKIACLITECDRCSIYNNDGGSFIHKVLAFDKESVQRTAIESRFQVTLIHVDYAST